MENRECWSSAITMLAAREHSVRELGRKLSAKNYSVDDVEQTLSALQKEGLLSDERFAEAYVRSKYGKGVGPVRLRHELREHDIADAAITELLQAYDWTRLANEVRGKRFGDALPQEYKARAKQMRFLQYRGFESVHISSALKQDEEW